MSRMRNTEPQLYKVYIKAEGEPKITKKEAEQQAAKSALEKMGAPLTGFPK